MSHSQRRINLIKKVRNSIWGAQQSGKTFNEELMIAVLGSDEGVSRRTAREYIACARKLLEEEKKQFQGIVIEDKPENKEFVEVAYD